MLFCWIHFAGAVTEHSSLYCRRSVVLLSLEFFLTGKDWPSRKRSFEISWNFYKLWSGLMVGDANSRLVSGICGTLHRSWPCSFWKVSFKSIFSYHDISILGFSHVDRMRLYLSVKIQFRIDKCLDVLFYKFCFLPHWALNSSELLVSNDRIFGACCFLHVSGVSLPI